MAHFLRYLSLVSLACNIAVQASPYQRRADTAIVTCLQQANVPFKSPTDSDWQTYSAAYNTRLNYAPAAVVLPTNNKHVSDAVTCAHQSGIKVQAKSGGHSYASFSSGGQDGSMIVDLRNFQDVLVDDAGIATVGSGLRLGNLELALHDQGMRALSHGTCKGVGLGGHFTHGGFGYTSRMWGLALDSIVALDVVLANGTLVHADNQTNSELFWGMRGAGDSLGIATTFYLQTSKAPDSIVSFSYNIPNIFQNVKDTVAVFQHIDAFVQNASIVDKNLGFGMYIAPGAMTVHGNYFGDRTTFESKIEPELLRGLPSPPSTVNAVQTNDWMTTLVQLDGSGTLQTPIGYVEHDNFYASSVTIPESSPLTAEAWTSFVSFVADQGANAGVDWYSIINLHGGPGSEINKRDTTFAAFRERGNLWAVQNWASEPQGTSPFPRAAIDFVKGLDASMGMGIPQGTELGKDLVYVDSELSREEAHQVYYGNEILGRLQKLKSEIDPDNVFWNPQSI